MDQAPESIRKAAFFFLLKYHNTLYFSSRAIIVLYCNYLCLSSPVYCEYLDGKNFVFSLYAQYLT